MSSMVLALIGLAALIAAYFIYSRIIASVVLKLEPEFQTPAHTMEDGIDFVPTNKWVLWGHHFCAIAGAAPIIGPGIAVIWGWLPAFLWIILASIFIGGVHDMGAIWASVRNRATSIGALTGEVVGPRARALFMIVIFLTLLMVNAVFAVAIASSFINTPSGVLPVLAILIYAFIVGQLVYRGKAGLGMLALFGIVFLYCMIYVGTLVPMQLPDELFGMPPNTQWIILLFLVAAGFSTLPVWMLMQPRDYINGMQLFLGLAMLYLAVVIYNPPVLAPAINLDVPEGTPSLIPLLFVTIGCGAVSGFHGLVSSGTTAKQLNKETDIRPVGYLGMLGEAFLALIVVLAATAGFHSVEEWRNAYVAFGDGGIAAFVAGGAKIVNAAFGFPNEFVATVLTVMTIMFAATTMDAGFRLQRYIVQETGQIYNVKALQGSGLATVIALVCCLALAFGAGGADGKGGMLIWPLFGTTNQLLASLTLAIVSVMVVKLGRPVWYTFLPMCFMLVVAVYALLVQLWGFYLKAQWLLLTLDVLILIAAILVTLEALGALNRERKAQMAARAA